MDQFLFNHYFPTSKPPRSWQARFLNDFLGRTIQQLSPTYPTQPKPFLLHAFPGTGKSIAQLVAAKYLKDQGLIDAVVIVVPWGLLVGQMIDDAETIGLQLDNRSIVPRPGFDGTVLTYGKIGYARGDRYPTAEALSDLCKSQRVMVIADECHHMGEGTNWPNAFIAAFNSHALVRLVTSGTPFRSDRRPIPWVAYKHNRIDLKGPDAFSFDYGPSDHDPKGALGHQYVRDVLFSSWAKGQVDFKLTTKDRATHAVIDEQEYSLAIDDNIDELYPCIYDDDGTKIVDNKNLRERIKAERRKAIVECGTERHPYGTRYVADQLIAANAQLHECRKLHPHASGLIVCMSIAHARAIEKALKFHTGEDAVTILSDEGSSAQARQQLKAFKNNRTAQRTKWLIAVAKVSEGVDIPHLRVCVYMTNVKASMRWTQILGRILRVEPGIPWDYQTAYFFQYDDGVDTIYDDETEQPLLNPDGSHQTESARIRLYAETLMEQRVHAMEVMPQQQGAGGGGGGGQGGEGEIAGGTYVDRETYSATGQEARQVYEGEAFSRDEITQEIKELAAHLNYDPIKIASLFRKAGVERWENAAKSYPHQSI